MGRFGMLRAVVAALLLAPACAYADPVFSGAAPASDFQLFPFWKKVLTDMQAPVTPQPQGSLEPVALVLPTPAAGPSPALLPAALAQAAATPICADERHCQPAVWTDFLATLKNQDPRAQLEAVNRWANAKPYVEDMRNWSLPDYWETPGEFIAHGGDCEDYAIAKYFSLVKLGFSPRDLRIVIVSDSKAHDFHAVLVAELNGTSWLLDNQLAEMVPLDSMPQYTPIYSLNEQGWWLHSQPVITVAANVVIAAAPLTAEPAPTTVRLAAK